MSTSVAPEPVSIVPAQTAAPAPSAVQQAAEAARTALGAGQSIDSGVPRIPAGQEQGGQFAPKPAPVAGLDPATIQKPQGEGQGTPAGEETPEAKQAREAAEAAGTVAETPEEIAEREAAEARSVELPLDDEATFVLSAETPEEAAQLRAFVAEAVEGRAARAIVEQLQPQVEEFEQAKEYAQENPMGFALQVLGKNIDAAEALARFLITQPSIYERISPTLDKLKSPEGFRTEALEASQRQRQLDDDANTTIQTNRVVKENFNDTMAMIEAMLPADLAVSRDVAVKDCMRDLQEYATRRKLITLPVHQIPALLAGRLTALGIDPEEAASRAAVAAARNGGQYSSPRVPPVRPAAPVTRPAPKAPAAAPKKDGKAFVASAARRKDASSIPGAGAGAPSNAPGLVAPRDKDGKPLGIAATVEWARQNLKAGRA